MVAAIVGILYKAHLSLHVPVSGVHWPSAWEGVRRPESLSARHVSKLPCVPCLSD